MDENRNRPGDDESGVGAGTHRDEPPNQPGTHAPMPGNVTREDTRDTDPDKPRTGETNRRRDEDRVASDR